MKINFKLFDFEYYVALSKKIVHLTYEDENKNTDTTKKVIKDLNRIKKRYEDNFIKYFREINAILEESEDETDVLCLNDFIDNIDNRLKSIDEHLKNKI